MVCYPLWLLPKCGMTYSLHLHVVKKSAWPYEDQREGIYESLDPSIHTQGLKYGVNQIGRAIYF